MEERKIAVIRLHGRTGLKKEIRNTLDMLRLYKKHSCVVVPNSKEYVGMISKVKDYVTWGEIDEVTFRLLLEKRGRLARKKPLTQEYVKDKLKTNIEGFVKELMESKKKLVDLPGLKPFFKLGPPRKGFERGGLKKQFALGGAVGYRKDKINELIQRMV